MGRHPPHSHAQYGEEDPRGAPMTEQEALPPSRSARAILSRAPSPAGLFSSARGNGACCLRRRPVARVGGGGIIAVPSSPGRLSSQGRSRLVACGIHSHGRGCRQGPASPRLARPRSREEAAAARAASALLLLPLRLLSQLGASGLLALSLARSRLPTRWRRRRRREAGAGPSLQQTPLPAADSSL